jgi:tRNA modification GTPase
MRGGFSEKLKELRERLIRFSALIELELDFSQEDVEFADRKQFYELIAEMQLTAGKLIASFQLGNVIKNGVSVAIIGKPNAGKSTLLNTLLNEERAIVSAIPGTTRDTIEELINIDGILFRLIDTAGIRQHTSDTIEAAGVERSLKKMKHSDLVVYLFDINDEEKEIRQRKSDMDSKQLTYILVANKADTAGEQITAGKFKDINNVIFISAKEKVNIELLKEKMVETIMAGQVNMGDTIVTNARHYEALKEVEKSLDDINAGLDNKLPGDLLALDIRRCLSYLGEITGEVSNNDMLDYIFSKFCIGK